MTCGSARRKGQLAAAVLADAYADGVTLDFICGGEVHGASPDLREYLESRGRAFVLRVASNFTLTLPGGTTMTCARAAKTLLKDKRSWAVRSLMRNADLRQCPSGGPAAAAPAPTPRPEIMTNQALAVPGRR